MRTRSKLLLTALTVALVMATAVGSASANHFSTSSQRFKITWESLELSGFATNVRCRVTLEGSFHSRTIAKVEESLVGAITSARLSHPCTGGEAWIYNGTEVLNGTTLANSLPWHIRYESFEGELPNINAINQRLFGSRFLVEAVFLGIRIRCNYTSNGGETRGPTHREAGGALTTNGSGGEISSESGCPRGRFIGEGPITTPEGARITVRLI